MFEFYRKNDELEFCVLFLEEIGYRSIDINKANTTNTWRLIDDAIEVLGPSYTKWILARVIA